MRNMHAGSGLLAGLLCALLIAGCATTAAVRTGAARYTPGTYTGTAKGRGGDVTATVTVNATTILSVTAAGDKETVGIGDKALASLPAAIRDAQSTAVDVVSGATITSKAVIAAANAALGKAAGKVPRAAVLRMTPGTYTASAKGFSAANPAYAHDVTVEVTVTADRLAAIKVVDNHETPAIMRSVQYLLPQRILDSQSLAVDAITGATATSNAITSAVEQCVVKAGGDPAALNRPVPRKTAVETYDCDVVVVGAGTSGCTAAAQAAELGAKVILVEKSARIGGTGALSSETTGINSNIQKKLGIQVSAADYYNEWQSQNHWKVNDPTILRAYIDGLGDDINWLEAHGFKFDQNAVNPFFGKHPNVERFRTVHHITTTPGKWNENASPNSAYSIEPTLYFEKMVSGIEPAGGKILLETDCQSFIMGDKGAVKGIVARRYDGTTVRITAKAVIMATGGYGANAELCKKEMGVYFPLFGLYQNDGTGYTLMTKAGAVPLRPTPCAHFIAVGGRLQGFSEFDTNMLYAIITDGALMGVNRFGQRISNEGSQFDSFLEYANYRTANGNTFFTLLSQKQVDTLRTQGAAGLGVKEFADTFSVDFLGYAVDKDKKLENIQAVLDAAVKQGIACKGATIAELARNAGMDEQTLVENVENYDRMCRDGADTQYGKPARLMNPLGTEGPYYAVKGQPYSYSNLGDVDINGHMQVVTAEGHPIPGLYAVGAESFSVLTDGVAYPDLGGPATSWCFYSGRTAAAWACKNLK